jgi:hypothetical protein
VKPMDRNSSKMWSGTWLPPHPRPLILGMFQPWGFALHVLLQIKKERKKFHATSRSPQNQKSAEKWEASPVEFHSQSLGILIQQSRQLKK